MSAKTGVAMAKVTDQDGVQWTVHRRCVGWYREVSVDNDWNAGNLVDYDVLIEWLQIMVVWPFWFIARWPGAPWIIVIDYEGRTVGQERVRGWAESRRRIQEIAQSAAGGHRFALAGERFVGLVAEHIAQVDA
jgi:hypothetical protein